MKYLRDLRKLVGLTQEEFASSVGIGRAYLNQLENVEDKQPSNDVKSTITEIVLIQLLAPVRRMMSDARRESESRAVVEKLVAYGREQGTNALSKLRVLAIIINDPTYTKPTVISGGFALAIYRLDSMGADLILLDDYSIDGLIRSFEARDRYIREQNEHDEDKHEASR